MKKLILVVLAVVVIGIIFRVVNKSDRVVVGSPTPSSIRTYTLAVLDNTVSVKSTDDLEFRVVSGQLEIRQGDEIKTDSRGRAKLLYPNGTITTIEPDTHLKVESLERDGDRSRVTLLVGSLWSKVKNVLGTGDYYEIETENTVASVRGTIFNTEFRNRITRVQGVESKIRVVARDPVKKTLIEGTGVDVASGEKVSVSSDQLPPPRKALIKQPLSDDDLRRPAVKRQILEQLEREDIEDAEKEREREFIKKVKERNLDDREFIEKLKEKRLIDDGISPSPRVTPTPTPTKTPTSAPISTLKLTPTPTPTPAFSPNTISSPTVSPTPVKPTVQSVSPKTTNRGATIAINGEGFLIGRSVPQISGVSLNKIKIPFVVIDGLTIFADVPGDILPSTYDVEVTTVGGDTLVLPQALIVQ